MPQQIQTISGRGIPLLLDDIDTDRIIPARYLRCVTFDGLGEHAFEDDRRQMQGHPFDDARFQGASILIAGRNFGCGSSREHAPQALMRWGVKAIVGQSFAEIFFGNCTSNGIPAVCCSPEALKEIATFVEQNPQATVTVDLVAGELRCGDKKFAATIQPGARQALTTGNWDFLGQLVDAADQVRETAKKLPYMSNFASV